MKELVILVLGIALADGLNPSTIAPALVLAVRRQGALLVAMFAAGVFVPSFAAGVLVVIGPGRALIALLPHVSPTAKHLLEIAGALALAVLAVLLWIHRAKVTSGMKRDPPGGPLGAAGLGAGIMLAELPTAIPYFAALAAIVGSSASLLVQLELVALFNVSFILPLLVIVGIRLLAGPRSQKLLDRTRDVLDRYIGVVLPCAVGVLALALLVTGVHGLVQS